MDSKHYFKKISLFQLFIVTCLSIALFVTTTFSAFNATATVTGTITFEAYSTIEIKKVYINGEDVRYTGGYKPDTYGSEGELGYPLIVNFKDSYDGAISTSDVTGKYAKAMFETGEDTTSANADISYRLKGMGKMHIKYEISFKYSPAKGQDVSNLATDVQAWNVHPIFSSFTAQKIQTGPSQFAYTYYLSDATGINAGLVYESVETGSTENCGMMIATPQVGVDTGVYFITYSIFIVGAGEEALESQAVQLDSSGIEISMSSLMSEIHYGYDYDDCRSVYDLTKGSLSVCTTCKISTSELF